MGATVGAGRELDALIAEKVMGRAVAGWGTAAYIEGEWSIHLGTDPAGWACHAGKHPLYVRHCQCDFLNGAYWAESEAHVIAAVREKHPEFKGDETPEPKVGGHYAGCLGVVPYYSADIAHAWAVAEKLRSFDPRIVLDNLSGEYFVSFGCDNEATAPTAPHAICLAALKAVGVDP